MAIYEYQCQTCGHIFEEVTMKLESKNGSAVCPECQNIADKIISSGSFVVHGYNANNGYSDHMK